MTELSSDHREAWAEQHQSENARQKAGQYMVQELRPGDRLMASGTTVLSVPVRRLALRADQRELRVRRSSGKVETVVWNARTRVGIWPRLP